MGAQRIFTDTGLLPPAGTPPVLNTHDVSPDMHFGGRAGIQWREADWAFELCGYYIPQAEESHTTAIPSRGRVERAWRNASIASPITTTR